jgi:hypothetical protein
LRPFKYSKVKTGLLSIGLTLTIIFSPITLHIIFNINPFIVLIVFVLLYILVSIIENKVLYKTEIVDQLFIDRNLIKTSRDFFEFNKIKELNFKNYVHPYKSWVARWKFCYILNITLEDGSTYDYLISKKHPPLTPEIGDLLEEIKHTNKQYFKKLKLTR